MKAPAQIDSAAIAVDKRQATRLLVRLLTGVLLLWAATVFAQTWRGLAPLPPLTLRLDAYLPGNGGWVGEPLSVESGREVRLTVKSVEGAHALRIAHTNVQSGILASGATQVISFTAPAPGRYVIACTLWCGVDHWRMRTVIEVIDPAAPDASLHYVQDAPRIEIDWDQLDVDAPHPAQAWPTQPVEIETGASLWQRNAGSIDPESLLPPADWPHSSPADLYLALQSAEGNPAFTDLSQAELWALVGFLWQARTSSAALSRGAAIYAADCASCHAADGSGNGFAAATTPSTEPDFGYAPYAAGASPLQYYAKIARGGMGTGMPNWGTLLSEDELWAVTDYLYTFLFANAHADPPVSGEAIESSGAAHTGSH